MSEPTITTYVSTLGRETLSRLLDSIAAQRLIPGDEVLVVVDRESEQCVEAAESAAFDSGDGVGADGPPVCDTCALVGDYGRYPGTWSCFHHEDHLWGHPQRNWLLDGHMCRGDLIVGNDDDDVFRPGAFDAIRSRAAASPGRVLLFRFETTDGNVLWQPLGSAARGRVREGEIGGHCIVVPNIPEKIGRWGRRYAGDFDFIRSTLDLHGGDGAAVWCPEVISTARPGENRTLHLPNDLRRGDPGPDSVASVVVTRSHHMLGKTLERLLAEQRPGDEVVLVGDGPQTPALSAAVDLAGRGLSVVLFEHPPAPAEVLAEAGRRLARAPRVVVVPEA